MKQFNFAEDVVSTEITVTDGFGDGGVGIIAGSSLLTSSLSSTQKSYYYNLQFNSKDHLSVSYGHIAGSGSASSNDGTGTTASLNGPTCIAISSDGSFALISEYHGHKIRKLVIATSAAST